MRRSALALNLSLLSALASACNNRPAAAASSAPFALTRCPAVFYDDFKTISVSPWGPGTRWIAHTPWNGDFGDAAFTDPAPGFPFSAAPDGLTIEARRIDGKWRSGLLASTDAQGRGFSQTYGYFEMRAKLPPGPGVWPAFWLATRRGSPLGVEIDVLEYYGHDPASFQSAIHVWLDGKQQSIALKKTDVSRDALVSAFHTYGVDVQPDEATYYLDRHPVWRVPTPKEHKEPLGILVNLALGSGFPIVATPEPSRMMVSYIAAYPPVSSCR